DFWGDCDRLAGLSGAPFRAPPRTGAGGRHRRSSGPLLGVDAHRAPWHRPVAQPGSDRDRAVRGLDPADSACCCTGAPPARADGRQPSAPGADRPACRGQRDRRRLRRRSGAVGRGGRARWSAAGLIDGGPVQRPRHAPRPRRPLRADPPRQRRDDGPDEPQGPGRGRFRPRDRQGEGVLGHPVGPGPDHHADLRLQAAGPAHGPDHRPLRPRRGQLDPAQRSGHRRRSRRRGVGAGCRARGRRPAGSCQL
ncbi:MAG: hypothetical protein AVDCRST_MAG61-1376, partial [uncultured Friedmanniella sp.]